MNALPGQCPLCKEVTEQLVWVEDPVGLAGDVLSFREGMFSHCVPCGIAFGLPTKPLGA